MIRGSQFSFIQSHQTTLKVVLITVGVALLLALSLSLRNNMAKAAVSTGQHNAATFNLGTSQSSVNDSGQVPAAANTIPANGSSSSSTSINSTTSSNGDGTVTTQMEVNGQPVDVPANGSTEQTITAPDGTTTTINASSSQSSTGRATSSSHTHVFTSIHSSSQIIHQGGTTP